MTDCEVCTHPHAHEVMAKVFQGVATYVDAARMLNLAPELVWKCFANHWEAQVNNGAVTLKAIDDADNIEDFVVLLRKAIRHFIDRLNEALQLPVSPYNEGAVTKLSAELRALMRDILEFQGKLQSAPAIQLTIIQMQMTKLTAFLTTELCDSDKEKLLKILPELAAQSPSVAV